MSRRLILPALVLLAGCSGSRRADSPLRRGAAAGPYSAVEYAALGSAYPAGDSVRVVVYHEPACVEGSRWDPFNGARIGWTDATDVALDAYGEATLSRPPTPSATLFITPPLSLTYPVLRFDTGEAGGVHRLLVFLHRYEPIDAVCDITQE